MKKQILTITLGLALGITTLAHAGAVVPGPTRDNALSFGLGVVTTGVLDATLTKSMNPSLRTALIFVGSEAVVLIVEAEKAAAQGRDTDNEQLSYGLGGTLLSYEIHF